MTGSAKQSSWERRSPDWIRPPPPARGQCAARRGGRQVAGDDGHGFVRLARRQWDLWKTRRVRAIDIAEMIHRRTVALNLDVGLSEWPQSRARQSASDRVLEFVRQLKQTLNEP